MIMPCALDKEKVMYFHVLMHCMCLYRQPSNWVLPTFKNWAYKCRFYLDKFLREEYLGLFVGFLLYLLKSKGCWVINKQITEPFHESSVGFEFLIQMEVFLHSLVLWTPLRMNVIQAVFSHNRFFAMNFVFEVHCAIWTQKGLCCGAQISLFIMWRWLLFPQFFFTVWKMD